MIRMALDLLIVLVPLQIFLGDLHGLNTLEYQPAKLAAIEGRYDTVAADAADAVRHSRRQERDDARRRSRSRDLGSLILTHTWDGAIKGLKEWPARRPPAGRRCRSSPSASWSASACIMLLVAIVGQVLLRWRGRLWRVRLVPAPVPVDGAARLHRRHRRLGRHRGRPPALDRLRPACAPRIRCRPRSPARDVAISLALYIIVYLDHVSDRHRLHGRAGAPRPAAGRASPDRSRAAGRSSPFEQRQRAGRDRHR